MKKFLTIVLAIGLIACFSACNNNEENKSGDNVAQSGENQEVNEGTVISLEGNGTTGYTWHATSYDETIIKVEELGTEPLNQDPDIVGAPSLFKFRITGLEGGSTTLVFDYYRSWEGSELAVDTKEYIVTVDNLLNVIATENVDIPDEPIVDEYTPSEELQTLVDTLITNSGVQFAMPGSSKILVANAPTFVGLSEDLFTANVVDSIVYEPMISPATSSMCIVKLSEEADMATLKQTVLDNCNPAKWICTGAEKCLVIESGRYIMLVMSTPDNCEALKTAFTNHFGADNVGEALTKDGVAAQDPFEDNGMAL
ncbi:MAG: protease inhibitor I42 family protein [Clostridia bacterium]|nr:protease inhibitor I42 family protein [Clostridia bacterium]